MADSAAGSAAATAMDTVAVAVPDVAPVLSMGVSGSVLRRRWRTTDHTSVSIQRKAPADQAASSSA